MKILLLSRYGQLGASSRIRSYQYLPYLKARGIDVKVSPLLSDDYIRELYAGKRMNLGDLLSAYLRRLWYLLKSHRFNLLWIEYEILPWLPAWAEAILSRLGIPYVVDYDDAVFHRYDMHPNSTIRALLANKIDGVMRRAAVVIVGNDYLADRAKRAGVKRLEFLPTVIDLNQYRVTPTAERSVFTIGWIGSPITARYLHVIEPALSEVCKDGHARLILVGSGPIELKGIPLEIRAWSEETEVADIQNFDVGIMPMPDDPWSRGKCGYKLIQYMGCSRPLVASPVGVNQKIVENGVNGFLATTTADWVNALRALRDPSDLRECMGRAGRHKVEMEYCIQITAPRLLSFLRGAAKG